VHGTRAERRGGKVTGEELVSELQKLSPEQLKLQVMEKGAEEVLESVKLSEYLDGKGETQLYISYEAVWYEDVNVEDEV
jgi:hypothetical protein